MRRTLFAVLVPLLLTSAMAAAQQGKFVVKPLAEKKVTELPSGPLFWRIETFATNQQAQAAAGPTSLAVEVEGKGWLFTLGPQGHSSAGGTEIAEIGPIPEVKGKHYLLRINEASGPPGSTTPVHTHPGSEAFYVLAGETSQKSPHGVARVGAGQFLAGHGADTPMQVSSSGSMDLRSLVMFLVDAEMPFSSPAKFE